MLNALELQILIFDAMAKEPTEPNFQNWHDTLLLVTDLDDSGTEEILKRLEEFRYDNNKIYKSPLDA